MNLLILLSLIYTAGAVIDLAIVSVLIQIAGWVSVALVVGIALALILVFLAGKIIYQ